MIIIAMDLQTDSERAKFTRLGEHKTGPDMRAWDYPRNTVEITCEECGRHGRYSKERYIELVGKDTPLTDALRIIAADCPKSSKSGSTLLDRCKARYQNLSECLHRVLVGFVI